MNTAPATTADLRTLILRRFRTHQELAEFVQPISAKLADLILARTVLLGEFVDALIQDCAHRGTLDQLRRALRAAA